MIAAKLFTFGYSGQSRTALFKFLHENNGTLCDVRFSPFSRNPEWAKEELLKALGGRYLHLQALGNVNYKSGGPILLKDGGTGARVVERLMADGARGALVFMCACPSYTSCHRRQVAELLTGRGHQVSELSLRDDEGLFVGGV
jgi:uncharacterized protein (DUF488 family)